MTETQLNLSPEERAFLEGLLKERLKETRIEEHRTRTPIYREHVIHNEDLISGLLAKIGEPVR